MGQLPHLAKAYARFKDQGFEILSYSMDEKLEDARKARQKHNMPWLHAIDPALKAFDEKMAETMYVWNLPTAYLVSADGTIVARDWQIENGKLEQILENFFAAKPAVTPAR